MAVDSFSLSRTIRQEGSDHDSIGRGGVDHERPRRPRRDPGTLRRAGHPDQHRPDTTTNRRERPEGRRGPAGRADLRRRRHLGPSHLHPAGTRRRIRRHRRHPLLDRPEISRPLAGLELLHDPRRGPRTRPRRPRPAQNADRARRIPGRPTLLQQSPRNQPRRRHHRRHQTLPNGHHRHRRPTRHHHLRLPLHRTPPHRPTSPAPRHLASPRRRHGRPPRPTHPRRRRHPGRRHPRRPRPIRHHPHQTRPHRRPTDRRPTDPGVGAYTTTDALVDVGRVFLDTAPEDRSGEDRTLVVVHVSAELLNPATATGNVPAGTSAPEANICHLDGQGPLEPATAQRLACDNPLLPASSPTANPSPSAAPAASSAAPNAAP